MEVLNGPQIKVYKDGRIVYDSHNPRTTRYYYDEEAEMEKAMQRSLALKEQAESHY